MVPSPFLCWLIIPSQLLQLSKIFHRKGYLNCFDLKIPGHNGQVFNSFHLTCSRIATRKEIVNGICFSGEILFWKKALYHSILHLYQLHCNALPCIDLHCSALHWLAPFVQAQLQIWQVAIELLKLKLNMVDLKATLREKMKMLAVGGVEFVRNMSNICGNAPYLKIKTCLILQTWQKIIQKYWALYKNMWKNLQTKDHNTTCVTSPVHSSKSNCSEMEIWYYYLFIYNSLDWHKHHPKMFYLVLSQLMLKSIQYAFSTVKVNTSAARSAPTGWCGGIPPLPRQKFL